MALDFNPSAPATLGEEWMPTVQAEYAIDADSKAVAVLVESTATETVDAVRLSVPSAAVTATIAVDVYASGTEIPGATSTTIFRPNDTIENRLQSWWKNGWVSRGVYSVNRNYSIDDVVRYLGLKYVGPVETARLWRFVTIQ